jgi:type II pantothenate kinase
MGTGTAFVKASGDEIARIGGSGVGGGTILGLASQILDKNDIDAVLALASDGNLQNIDLMVKDIIYDEIPSLPADLTAANFGNIKSTASQSDIALGIINMVFEVIGMLAVFALRNESVNDVVLTGTLATFPQAYGVFEKFKKMTGLNFIIPPNAIFATALGASSIEY